MRRQMSDLRDQLQRLDPSPSRGRDRRRGNAGKEGRRNLRPRPPGNAVLDAELRKAATERDAARNLA